ncbi:hypothetical protein KFL_005320070 [Klebsormidium nitens]|uniref:Uncharacterized protein n=1 Tax=Klebsormidium nitens TaxID=105231 RepID=A0A1Y1IF54_KLENI|nr:hypothetical protein KFL_005320070 [Klebsormidium nitens]|eukprot:GAQ89525.1 hypothetical protein KFL_005320070 [Klebsormidium nitens]
MSKGTAPNGQPAGLRKKGFDPGASQGKTHRKILAASQEVPVYLRCGPLDEPIKSDLMSQIRISRDDPERVSIFEPGAINMDRSIANSVEKQRWELYDADGRPQQQIETIIVEEAVESESAYAQRFQAASSPTSRSTSSRESTSPTIVKVPGQAVLDFFEDNLDPQVRSNITAGCPQSLVASSAEGGGTRARAT